MSDANNSATDDEIVDFSENDNPVKNDICKSPDRGARDIKPERPAARRPEPIKPASEKPAAPKPQNPKKSRKKSILTIRCRLTSGTISRRSTYSKLIRASKITAR